MIGATVAGKVPTWTLKTVFACSFVPFILVLKRSDLKGQCKWPNLQFKCIWQEYEALAVWDSQIKWISFKVAVFLVLNFIFVLHELSLHPCLLRRETQREIYILKELYLWKNIHLTECWSLIISDRLWNIFWHRTKTVDIVPNLFHSKLIIRKGSFKNRRNDCSQQNLHLTTVLRQTSNIVNLFFKIGQELLFTPSIHKILIHLEQFISWSQWASKNIKNINFIVP